MTYQEWIYGEVFDRAENFSRNFELKDLVPKQVYDKIFDNVKEDNMTYQDAVEQWRSAKIKADERFEAYKKTVEGMDGCTHHFDEMATEVINRFEGTIQDIVEEVIDDYCYDMPEADDRNDIFDKLINAVRKKMYDGLKPCFEKEETKTKTRVDYKYKLGICKKDAIGTSTTAKEETKMSIYESHIYNGDYTCHIKLDRISGDCDQAPTYEFHGETTDIDKMLSQIKKRGGMPIANRIWQNDGRHTTVEWRDGTKTTVCCEDPEKYTEWGGFCACVVKKLYGSATKAELELKTAKETTAWPKKKKQMEREKIKKMCRERHDRAVMEREEKIAAKMEEMWIANEATKRMYADDSKVEVKEDSENA